MKLIPFKVTIPESQRDKGLSAKLMAEAPGILAWAVQWCLKWQQEGLGEPPAVRVATAEYRVENDTLGEFLDSEHCTLDPSAWTY